jgi:uncharacterized protein YjbI with pentapeptide repeats
MCAGATTGVYPVASEKKRVQGCKPGNSSCQRTQRLGSLYCLAHDPGAKDYKQFMDGLLQELEDAAKNSLNAEGWVFPSDEDGFVKLPFVEASKPIILKNAEFRGEVYFKSNQFLHNVDFSGARFNENADFTDAHFKEDESGLISKTSFDGAQFEQEVKFESTVFLDKVSFVGCRFKAEVKMNKSTQFDEEALFNQTQFEGETTMSGANFKGKADFTDAFFKKYAKFVGTIFNDQALFERTNFAELVEFNNAEFSRSAAFVNAVFQQRVVFEETKFWVGGDISFNKTKFNGSASFEKSQFERLSYFTETEFAQKVEFSKKAKFTQPAHFEKTVFNEVSFADVEFKQSAKFVGTRFNGWAEFSRTEFSGETIFDRTQFSHLTVFNKVTFGQNVSFNVHVNERNRLAIRSSDLSMVRFSGSNIDNIEFQDCKWIETKFYRWKIGDEPPSGTRTPEQIKKLTEARRLYRQLRLNYDKVGEYEIAGRFYVSESEMSYLLRAPVYRWIHPRGLYKWASRYGQSIVQAAFGMFALILVFTLFYYWFSAARPIWFRETPKPLSTQNLLTLSWWESVWLSVQASKPLADLGLSPKTIVYWIVLVEGLIVPTQIGLFLLAIRRRFRRGD